MVPTDDTVVIMTPEEELARLNRVIRQYETVYRTTSDGDQKTRVEKQLKELKDYREKILAVNVIDDAAMQERRETRDALAAFPRLKMVIDRDTKLASEQRMAPLWARGEEPTPAQEEIFHLMLYVRWFRDEYLPFLTEKRLKLDFKYSLDRDAFYSRLQEVERKLKDFRGETAQLAQGIVSRDMEIEMRKRVIKLKRHVEADAAKLFQAVRVFARELQEDAAGDGVKCLNGGELIEFDPIEGERVLEGKTAREALQELSWLASEVEAFLNVPDIDSQETEGADRH